VAADLGNELNGYSEERWLDIRSANVRTIMTARLDLAVQKGCTGVEPDNVGGFEPGNHSGFTFTANDQIGFNTFLATACHARNLAVALKNDSTDRCARTELRLRRQRAVPYARRMRGVPDVYGDGQARIQCGIRT